MPYLIYLRKSRADIEAEQRGEGETLTRHRSALLSLAERMKLDVGGAYEEVVSGETIAARPQMQKLLSEVESGMWEGVLVMEVERLARGDSIDQGIVAQAFKYSGTKIITPFKIYNPADEFDEEYFEFGLFMSRREYKTIKRRMIAGRIASVKEGKYMGKTNPYGYHRIKLERDKGYTLELVPEQAQVVREIYDMRLSGMGCYKITRQLNARGLRTTAGIEWSGQSVINILRNPLYAGYVTWGRKPGIPTVKNGVLAKPRKTVDDYIKVKGLHPAIVTDQEFETVQHLLENAPAFPIKKGREITNPFAGLLYCAKCGHVMIQLSPRGKPRLCCNWPACDNVSSSRDDIESVLMDSLRIWLANYDVNTASHNTLYSDIDKLISQKQNDIAALHHEEKKLDFQLERASELVEQGVYTTEHFVTRQNQIIGQRRSIASQLDKAEMELLSLKNKRSVPVCMAPKIRHILEAYPKAQSALEKNELLKDILVKIVYSKNLTKPKSRNYRITLKLFRKFATLA